MRKLVFSGLMVTVLLLQVQIWFGRSSVRAINQLEATLDTQRQGNAVLEQRNRQLEVEILDLKNGLEAVEERARSELGMIGKDETFYLIVD